MKKITYLNIIDEHMGGHFSQKNSVLEFFIKNIQKPSNKSI